MYLPCYKLHNNLKVTKHSIISVKRISMLISFYLDLLSTLNQNTIFSFLLFSFFCSFSRW